MLTVNERKTSDAYGQFENCRLRLFVDWFRPFFQNTPTLEWFLSGMIVDGGVNWRRREDTLAIQHLFPAVRSVVELP